MSTKHPDYALTFDDLSKHDLVIVQGVAYILDEVAYPGISWWGYTDDGEEREIEPARIDHHERARR